MIIKCTICLQQLEKDEVVGYLRCGHVHHDGCIRMWLKKSKSCPDCRMKVCSSKRLYLTYDEDQSDSQSLINKLQSELDKFLEKENNLVNELKKCKERIKSIKLFNNQNAREAEQMKKKFLKERIELVASLEIAKEKFSLLELNLDWENRRMCLYEKENEKLTTEITKLENFSCDQRKEIEIMQRSMDESEERMSLFRIALGASNKTIAEKDYEIELLKKKLSLNVTNSDQLINIVEPKKRKIEF